MQRKYSAEGVTQLTQLCNAL